ncbi:MAG: hypothetical protein AAGN82_09895 [Myxococcota bacterium]
MSPDAVATAAGVEALARWLFEERAGPTAGVVHPTACVGRDDGRLLTLEIKDGAPQSAHDTFALHLQRARADVIVTTGAILRNEPGVTYGLEESPYAAGLRAHRRSRCQTTPPRLVVLSASGDIARDHPAWTHPHAEVWGRVAVDGVSHRAFDGTAAEAVATLKSEGLVVVEAGPSVTRPLYAARVIDTLYLSTVETDVAPSLLGGVALDAGRIPVWMRPAAPEPRRVATSDANWFFARHDRR